MPFPRRLASPTLVLAALAGAGPFAASAVAATAADELSDLKDALCFGKPSATVRYRYEHVDQATFAKDADASTLRAALGYETKPFHGLSVFGQYEGVYVVGNDLYRSPVNTKTQYPAVADPAVSELNQAFIKYTCPSDPWKTTAKLGRQEVLLNNQRFVGNVGFRQDTQTFDGGSLAATPYATGEQSLNLYYAYLSTVHRVFSDDSLLTPPGRLDMHSNIANATYAIKGVGALSAYGVFLRYTDPTVQALSSRTIGARLEGPYAIDADWSVVYAAEFAQQRDFGDNPTSYTADYLLGELGMAYKGVSLKAGYEVLQGDSATDKLNTPLATLHAFDGWADLFLTTPNNGLVATYLWLAGPVPAVAGLTAGAVGLDYHSQSASMHYGRELDLLLEYRVLPFDKNLLLGLKYARFIGDDVTLIGGAAVEHVNKFWAYTQYSF
jgi:hypothetical protein